MVVGGLALTAIFFGEAGDADPVYTHTEGCPGGWAGDG